MWSWLAAIAGLAMGAPVGMAFGWLKYRRRIEQLEYERDYHRGVAQEALNHAASVLTQWMDYTERDGYG